MASLLAIGVSRCSSIAHRGGDCRATGSIGSDGRWSRFWGWCATATWDAASYFSNEAYDSLALKTFERISGEVDRRWPGVRLALHHRTGRVDVGQASVAIAAASPHRADAYAACRYTIERVKQIAPVWKREFFEGGDVWIEGATADPTDETARAEAERTACA
jgi:molybdopterin synthase catalytic subunit